MHPVKSINLTVYLAMFAFALGACKPKPQTTEEKVPAGADKVTEGINRIVGAGARAVEKSADQAPASPAK